MDEEKRKEVRKRADHLRAKYEALERPLEWFEELYQEAGGDPELIPWGGNLKEGGIRDQTRTDDNTNQMNKPDPWAHGQARFPLIEWLAREDVKKWISSSGVPKKALDIGCGLGANAIALHNAGLDVTAFDISQTAVKWAASLAPDCEINWRCENLLNLPEEWTGKFDLVSEIFTIQALYGKERLAAMKALSKLVAPKGKLLIICRGRKDETIPETPPLPLSSSELDQIEAYGFTSDFRREYFDNKTPPNLHFLAEFTKN